MEEKLMKLCDKLNAYLKENNMRHEVELAHEGWIKAEISWGDWKHDHARFEYLLREFMKEHEIEYVSDEIVTEEDGSDCYSAAHYVSPMGMWEV